MPSLDPQFLIVIGSALAAALSFAAFAYPFLVRSERKDRYRDIIEKKRKSLFENAKAEVERKGAKSVSAKDSVATFFKVQEMAGEYGEKTRILLLQAGIRNPMAPVYYIVAQIALPVIFALLTVIFMSGEAGNEEEVSSTMKLVYLGGAAMAGFFMPRVMIKNAAIKRQEEIDLTFPDALDMMLICVQGGIGLEQAVDRIAEEIAEHSPVLAEELGILSAEMAMLNDRRTALSDFGRRIGGYAKSFATALIQAEQYGTSISQALRVMANELREVRMSKAEEKAASLPPKLTVPMILFFLPALFVIILGPAIIQAGNAGVGG